MKTISTTNNSETPFESTYALLVRSEEKQRSRFEMLIYLLLVAATTFAVSQLGREAATIPMSVTRVAKVVATTGAPPNA